MIFEICAGIATLVFIILAIYIIQTLIAVQRSLNRLTDLAVKLDTKIDPIAQETFKTLQNTTDLTDSVKVKLDAFDPLFQGINDLGCAIKHAARPVQEEKKKQWQDTIAAVIELAAVGVMLWQQIKKRR